MNYFIEKVDFLIKDFDINSTNIINSKLELFTETNNIVSSFKITNFLGKGTIGQVYLIENEHKKYVIKISNDKCHNDLFNELDLIRTYFSKGKIVHKAYPIYFGNFINLNAFAIIYQYLGFYNLEKIKSINYKITFNYNRSIIKQLILQLTNFSTIIHGDLKPSNVVIDIVNNDIIATIIDFGLIREKNGISGLISTNYITSPESLLTLEKYKKYHDPIDTIDMSKHDYYGLFCICINLFVKNNYWKILSSYINNFIKIDNVNLMNHSSIEIFVYVWYRFYYSSINELPNITFQNLIRHIEKKHKTIKNKTFYSFELFYEQFVVPYLDPTLINVKYIFLFMEFLKKISHFDPNQRSELNSLLFDDFFN